MDDRFNCYSVIANRETFKVAAVISQRGKEKGVIRGSKYQNRYPFSTESSAQNVEVRLNGESITSPIRNILHGAVPGI